MVACYSARLGWLPQEKDFYRVFKNKKPTDNDENSSQGQINFFNVAKFDANKVIKFVDIFEDNDERNDVIEFDNKSKEFKYCCGYSVVFEFSNNSINYLFRLVSNMKTIENKFRTTQKRLKLGECIKNVNLSNIIQLLRFADNKITVEFDDTILKQIMNRDKLFIRSIKNPRDNLNSKYNYDEYLVVDIVKLGNHDFFKVMLELDADINVQSKN